MVDGAAVVVVDVTVVVDAAEVVGAAVVVVDVTVVVGAVEVVVGPTVVVVDVTVVVGTVVVVGAAVVVVATVVVGGATVVGVSLVAVSVVPPEQAETNNARTRNRAVFRFMIKVCHGTPERFSVMTRPLGRPLLRPETTGRVRSSRYPV